MKEIIKLGGDGESIKSLASILFIKSKLPYRAPRPPDVVLNFIS